MFAEFDCKARPSIVDNVLIIVAAGAIAGGFVQGLSGFGFGLVAMSFWAWVLDPVSAASMSVTGGFLGQMIAALSIRRSVNLPLLGPYLLGGAVGLPLGITILPFLDIYIFEVSWEQSSLSGVR